MGSLEPGADKFVLSFYATDSSGNRKQAFIFELNLIASIEILVQDFIAYKQEPSHGIENVKILLDNTGIKKDRDYTSLFN